MKYLEATASLRVYGNPTDEHRLVEHPNRQTNFRDRPPLLLPVRPPGLPPRRGPLAAPRCASAGRVMLTPPDDDTTPWVPLRTGKCKGCGSGQSECFGYPATNMDLVLCVECLRGANRTVAKELRRRRVTQVAKA